MIRNARVILAVITTAFIAYYPFDSAQAKYIGGDYPVCRECACKEQQSGSCSGGSCRMSLTQGNFSTQYTVQALESVCDADAGLRLSYSSYNADDTRAQIDSGLGYGWTHTYNLFLFSQAGHMFRMGSDGSVTRFRRSGANQYTATTGYFETLQRSGVNFLITKTDGTSYQFASIPDTPFYVGGPVWRLVSITDRNGNITTLTYSNGDLTMVTDTYGRTFTFKYVDHRLKSVIDPLGRKTNFTYDTTGRTLTSITDPQGNKVRYGYNFLYQMTTETDKDGRVSRFVYRNGLPVAVVDGDGNTQFDQGNPSNWATDPQALASNQLRDYIPATTTSTDGRGNQWKYDYDVHGYITRMTAPDGAVTSYTYDPATLLVASVTDANGNATSYQYDAHGNLTGQTDALGHTTTYIYANPAGFAVPLYDRVESITDPNGRVTQYQYDTHGNRVQETDPLGHVQTWTYDAKGHVATRTDRNGNLTRYTYDANGYPTRIVEAMSTPAERTTTYVYDTVGNMLSRTDDNGHTTTYVYDALNRPVTEIDSVGNATTSTYDAGGNIVQIVDKLGNSTTFQYDQRQRLIRTTDALGQVSTQAYDNNNNRTSMSDNNGNTTTYTYDVQDRLIKTTDALGNTASRGYDGVGNVLTETDANGHTTQYQYDALDRRISTIDAVGGETDYEYDGAGPGCPACTGPTPGSSLIAKMTDGNGKVTYYQYDGLDRPITQIQKEGDTAAVIDPSDAVTTTTYDPNSNRLSITEPNGNTTTYVYDALNRRVQEVNAAGDTTQSTYDGVGNAITTTLPNGNIITYTYDALDRTVMVADSIGLLTRYTYDAVGNRLSERDGNDNGADNSYDALYRLVEVTDALGGTTRYSYDPVGNLLERIDREGNPTRYTYDALYRRTEATDALGNTTLSEYDATGNLRTITDANGNATQYQYDAVNRLLTETYADGGTRAFTYDFAGNLLTRTDQNGQTTSYVYNDLYFLVQRDYPVSADDTFTYDLSGRMESAERYGWLVTFEYDGANRVTETTQYGRTVTYTYDVPGRSRTVTYPGGRTIVERMDARSRLETVDDVESPPPIVEYIYDTGNRVSSRTYRNGVAATYGYNANNWIVDLDHADGGAGVAAFRYEYDREGNKRFEERLHDTPRSEAYQYDAIYRLIDYTVGDLVGSSVPIPITQTAYNLDPVGNWGSKVTDGITQNRGHNAVNELTAIDSVPLDYDDNGNVIADERYLYFYDEENRLAGVIRRADAQFVSLYLYDALGRRVVKIARPALVWVGTGYFYDDARVIEEQNGAEVTEATYVYGNYVDEVLTMDRGGQAYYYHQNALWSVAAITDSAANVVEQYAYDAYGCVMVTDGAGAAVPVNSWGTTHSDIGNPYLFTGRQLDEETGLYSYRARHYDCEKGRFLQRDPVVPQQHIGLITNYYAYVGNRSPNYTDPYGLKLLEVSTRVDWRVSAKLRGWSDSQWGVGVGGNWGFSKNVARIDVQSDAGNKPCCVALQPLEDTDKSTPPTQSRIRYHGEYIPWTRDISYDTKAKYLPATDECDGCPGLYIEVVHVFSTEQIAEVTLTGGLEVGKEPLKGTVGGKFNFGKSKEMSKHYFTFLACPTSTATTYGSRVRLLKEEGNDYEHPYQWARYTTTSADWANP